MSQVNAILQFFAYDHLLEYLQTVSKSIGDLAVDMDKALPDCAEKSAGLRKLLEAKDCFVRAALPSRPMRQAMEKESAPSNVKESAKAK